jgi:ankyrin repeat protein
MEDDGVNLAMVTARAGRLDVLDLLLNKEMNFSVVDTVGRNIMHYAVTSKTAEVVPHLLTHAKTNVRRNQSFYGS